METGFYGFPGGAVPPSPAGGGAGAMTRIAQQVLTASAASVTLPGIPGSYTDLRITGAARSDNAAGYPQLQLQLNGDTGSNYLWRKTDNASGTQGLGAAFANLGNVIGTLGGNTAGVTTFDISIPNYAGTVLQKGGQSHLTAADPTNTNIYDTTVGFLWKNTGAVSSITFFCNVGNFVAGSTFTIWGIS